MDKKIAARIRRSARVRYKLKKIHINRLVIHRTIRHIYAQIIKDNSTESKTFVSASTIEKNIKEQVKYTGNKEAAALIGKLIAERALAKGIQKVAFDRSYFKYHGRIQSLAEAAREFGLKF